MGRAILPALAGSESTGLGLEVVLLSDWQPPSLLRTYSTAPAALAEVVLLLSGNVEYIQVRRTVYSSRETSGKRGVASKEKFYCFF